MIYHWQLGTGAQISADNEGAQTVVTLVQASAGQQQRTSNSFTTGIWIAPPHMTLTPTGGILKIITPSGESLIEIQGNSISLQTSHSGTSQSTSSSSSSTFTADTQSMPPMQPMQMGNMQMNMQPMTMRMGDRELTMGATSQQRFCSECGTPVKPTDKFCASCGHKLG
ncbi:zinc ribbon domain-containing protein [Chamaesiphon sp.]|uniref:zinc ribbon domain-containing protein n=1 Tax=Chamaesiphon sp. TaxID=2814140 RepID=UPI0035946AAB